MRPDDGHGRATTLLVGGILLAIVVLGVGLRLQEPLRSPALGAEDPYTHVVFTKEVLERGYFADSFYLGTGMYPPGFHAFAGALAPLAGFRLYDLARFSPVAFGALAILGTFVLARRLGGDVAGLSAALVTAIMPEHVFRTNLFFPTALDLALVPALLLLFVEAYRTQRWGPAVAFLALSVALAFTHPWLLPLYSVPALAAVALHAARDAPSARDVLRRLLLPSVLAAVASSFAMASRWKRSDTGFADFIGMIPGVNVLSRIDLPAPMLFLALGGLFLAAAMAGALVAAALGRVRAALPRTVRLVAGAGAAAALVAVAIALADTSAKDVHYPAMLGAVPIALALGGIVVALVRPTPLGDLGLAIAVLLFPLTAIDLFQSPFWPSRTVVYLSVGTALLAGAAMAALAQGGVALATSRRASTARWIAPVAVVASLLLLGGAVAAKPPSTYDWYRLYDEDDFEGFERTAGVLALDPDARAVVFSWQPALLVKTLASPAQARYAPSFFSEPWARDKVLSEGEGAPIYVVVDKHVVRRDGKGVDLSFLHEDRYELVYRSADGGFRLYRVVDAS